MSLKPRQPVPVLSVSTLGGSDWTLNEKRPENFTSIVFYRGLHCPICKGYIRDLDRRAKDFADLGIDLMTISCDDESRARQTREDWGLEHLSIGYGLSIDRAREWGLYISTSRGKTSTGIEEPALFSEPGLFLVRPDNTLYFSSVQTMPFARPAFAEVLQAVKFVIEKDYPARGEA